jgi:hypothetical protein
MKENRDLIEKTRMRVKKIVKDKNPMTAADEDYIKNKVRNDLGQFLFKTTNVAPWFTSSDKSFNKNRFL